MPHLLPREFCRVYACICHAVSMTTLDAVIAAGARTEEEVGEACYAGTGCGGCLDRICDRLRAADPLHGLEVPTSVA